MAFPEWSPELGLGALFSLVIVALIRVILWMIGLLPSGRADRDLARQLKEDVAEMRHLLDISLAHDVDFQKRLEDTQERLELIRLDLVKKSP